jgi:hypothetical protein
MNFGAFIGGMGAGQADITAQNQNQQQIDISAAYHKALMDDMVQKNKIAQDRFADEHNQAQLVLQGMQAALPYAGGTAKAKMEDAINSARQAQLGGDLNEFNLTVRKATKDADIQLALNNAQTSKNNLAISTFNADPTRMQETYDSAGAMEAAKLVTEKARQEAETARAKAQNFIMDQAKNDPSEVIKTADPLSPQYHDAVTRLQNLKAISEGIDPQVYTAVKTGQALGYTDKPEGVPEDVKFLEKELSGLQSAQSSHPKSASDLESLFQSKNKMTSADATQKVLSAHRRANRLSTFVSGMLRTNPGSPAATNFQGSSGQGDVNPTSTDPNNDYNKFITQQMTQQQINQANAGAISPQGRPNLGY